MKKTFLFYLVIILIGLQACSQKEKLKVFEKEQDVEFANIPFDFSTIKFNKTPVHLFTVTTVNELHKNIDRLLPDLIKEIDEIMATNANGSIDYVQFNMTFKEGQATLSNVVFANLSKKTIINTEIANSKAPDCLSCIDWDVIVSGVSPSGWTRIGTYMHADAVASKTKEVLDPALSENGSCVQLQFAIGAFGVNIYKKSW